MAFRVWKSCTGVVWKVDEKSWSTVSNGEWNSGAWDSEDPDGGLNNNEGICRTD